ncbi:MAG: glycosyltransferase family 4 protein [Almyronema sp.]
MVVKTPNKVLLLFENYGPYHLARLAAAHNYSCHFNAQIIGLELSRFQKRYIWHTQFDNNFSPLVSVISDRLLEEVSKRELFSKLFLTLNDINPDVVVIAGYAEPAMLATLLWSLIRRKPAILMSESKEDDYPRFFFTEQLKGWLIKLFKAALVGGQPQKRYLMKLGKAAESIFTGYNVVGNEAFHPQKIRHLPSPLAKPYFLAINRFVPKKNLDLLLKAYAIYRQQAGHQAWDLVLAGDGELRVQIEQQVNHLSLQPSVHLPGFLQQSDLLPYFAHAACFVHASIQEQWGLVVNEAMAAGLPVIVSNRCGCFEDLVIEGVNGFGFDPTRQLQLTELMLKVSAGNVDLDKMGTASLAHIQKFSPVYFAQGLKQAVEYALAHA